MHVGRRIKMLREDWKLTQQMLADRLNLSQPFLSNLESAKTLPSRATLLEIANIFDMTLTELLRDTEQSELAKRPIIETAIAYCSNTECGENDNYGNWQKSRYDLYNEDGEVNKYCGKCGSVLISRCENCGRHIKDSEQKFCLGCGKPHFMIEETDPEESAVIDPEKPSDFDFF